MEAWKYQTEGKSPAFLVTGWIVGLGKVGGHARGTQDAGIREGFLAASEVGCGEMFGEASSGRYVKGRCLVHGVSKARFCNENSKVMYCIWSSIGNIREKIQEAKSSIRAKYIFVYFTFNTFPDGSGAAPSPWPGVGACPAHPIPTTP